MDNSDRNGGDDDLEHVKAYTPNNSIPNDEEDEEAKIES